MSNKIRKEQIDNGENLLFGGEDLSLGSSNIETSGNVIVADEVYSSDWNGSTEVPTKNAVYDKLETILVSGDVASVNGATGIVVLDTDDISEGATNQYHTDERAQDAVGAMVDSTLVYTDATPVLKRAAITGDVTIADGSNTSAIASGVIVNADINASAGIDATKIADGTVTSAEFQRINSLTSNAQTQLDAKVPNTGDTTIAGVKTFSSIPVLPGSDPTTANQAVRKSYVDAIAQTVDPSLYKNSCEIATTANISLSGEQTIDTFATSATRVLVWKQTAPAENGIYISNSGAWSRASDYNTAGEVLQGTSTFIVDGSANKNKLFVMNAASITTIGTDPITFTPLSSLNEYIAGDGIDITGNTISVDVNGTIAFTDETSVENSIPVFGDEDGKLVNSGLKINESTDTSTINKGDSRIEFNRPSTDSYNIRTLVGNTSVPNQIKYDHFVTMDTTAGGFDLVRIYNQDLSAYVRNQIQTYESGGLGSGLVQTLLIAPRLYYEKTISDNEDFGEFFVQNIYRGASWKFSARDSVADTSDYGVNLSTQELTEDREIDYPDASGTLALTSDISPSTDIQVFTSDGTWTKPAGAKSVHVQLIGGGGGGGSGRKGAVSTIRCGGGGGGNGGTAFMTFNASVLGSTETVTVGTGGAGGASRTTNDTNGLAGTAGETTFFGGWLRAGRGSGGSGGTNASGTGGTSGQTFPYGTAGTSGASASTSGGPGSGGGGASALAPGGGASGAGLTTGNIASGGGNGQGIGVGGEAANSGYATSVAGGSGGGTNTNGGNGNASPTNTIIGGTGGGGGGSSTTTNAGNGGNAGLYGAGGGGGGAAVNSVGNSGAGGSGANGICIVVTYF